MRTYRDARADKRNLEFSRPAVLLHLGRQFRDRGGKVRSEGTVDMRLELR